MMRDIWQDRRLASDGGTMGVRLDITRVSVVALQTHECLPSNNIDARSAQSVNLAQ